MHLLHMSTPSTCIYKAMVFFLGLFKLISLGTSSQLCGLFNTNTCLWFSKVLNKRPSYYSCHTLRPDCFPTLVLNISLMIWCSGYKGEEVKYDLIMQPTGRNQWSISHKGLFYEQTYVNKPYCESSNISAHKYVSSINSSLNTSLSHKYFPVFLKSCLI